MDDNNEAADETAGGDALAGDLPEETDAAAVDGAFGSDDATLSVDPAPYPDLSDAVPVAGEPRDLRLLSDIELELCVEIGRARLPLRQLLALTPGSVVELDRAPGEPVDVLVNGKLVARGQIVTIADEFGVRLSEIVDPVAAPSASRRR